MRKRAAVGPPIDKRLHWTCTLHVFVMHYHALDCEKHESSVQSVNSYCGGEFRCFPIHTNSAVPFPINDFPDLQYTNYFTASGSSRISSVSKPGRCTTYTCSQYVLCARYPTTEEPFRICDILLKVVIDYQFISLPESFTYSFY